MRLKELFKDAPDIEIEQLSTDSRMPMKNAIFFCLNGIKYNGHDYVDEAIRNGAVVIIYSKDIPKDKKAIYIKVGNVSQCLNRIATVFYHDPNKGMDEYVVCGNYGRSSVSSMIQFYLNHKSSCGYVGILGIRYKDTELKTSFATLDALDNFKLLEKMRNEDIHSCTFEATPAGLNLQKLDGLSPVSVIYTCTNQNSSEFQSCDYYSFIRKYLYTLEENTRVILNADDESFHELDHSIESYVTYGTSTLADYQIRDISCNSNGITFKIIYQNKTYPVKSSLQSLSNVYNMTAAIASLHENDYELTDIIDTLKDMEPVKGIVEKVDSQYNVIVDCAYDLCSIETLLKYGEQIKRRNRLIGIIGINYSDSDQRIKRIIELCDQYLDLCILTEDESLEGEVMKILERCDIYDKESRFLHCGLRSIAIENAIEIMNENDIVLIIGKGSENYLDMGLGKEFYYGDRHYAIKYIEKRRREENEIIEVY